MKILSRYLKSLHPELPEDWTVYALNCLPASGITTHVQIIGAVPRLLKSGPRKGQMTWRDAKCKQEFVLSIEEYQKAVAFPAPEAARAQLQLFEGSNG